MLSTQIRDPLQTKLDAALAPVSALVPNRPVAEMTQNLKMLEAKRDARCFVDFAASIDARRQHIAEYGFVLLTEECVGELVALLEGLNCLEVGAGTGWLSHLLCQKGLGITASERRVTGNSYGFTKTWCNDHNGDSLDLLPGNFDAVILAWPNYESDFGLNVIEKMKSGQILVYQGEGKGGCTGTDEMHDVLDDETLWTRNSEQGSKLNKVHLQFSGIHDYWHVYTKR